MPGAFQDSLWPLAAVLALLLLTAGWALGRRWRDRQTAGASRTRNRRAQAGEEEAEVLLREFGFHVVERQVRAIWWIEIDGEKVELEVRADLLVEEDETGRRFVAEVKTGEVAPEVSHPATRRQLLEYAHVFAPMGVLLVDVEGGEVHEVGFGV